MYKVVLVDDEPWALTWIERIFNWEALGFEVIAQTTDSAEAYNIICREKPDVVFTDIRMPEYTGIDLLKMVRKKGLDTEFVIISGFAEFSYAQQALQEGAFDYRLKPVQMNETEELLKKLSIHLETKQSIRHYDLYEELIEKNSDIAGLLDSISFKHENKYFQVLSMLYLNTDTQIAPMFLPKDIKWYEFKLGAKKSVYLLDCNSNIYNEIAAKYQLQYNLEEMSIGISSLAEDAAGIPRLIKEADKASGRIFISGKGGVYSYSKNNISLIRGTLEKVISAIDTKRSDELKSILESVPQYFRDHDLGLEEVLFLWNQIVAYMTGKHSEKIENLGFEYMKSEQLVDKFENLSAFCNHIYKLFVLFEQSEDANINTGEANKNFEELLEYINLNFNQRLYLKELAHKFYINSTYCCDLFKKVTGSTFSEYITSMRMKKARELLEKGDNTIEQICEEVGYIDYYYFNTIFKKYHGITPVKYRKLSK
jgi:two-component system, response regulator YesN